MIDDMERLKHILKAIENIEEHDDGIRGLTAMRAVEREFSIIGEAANHVSKPLQQAHPEVSWREIIGYRNKLVHGYFGMDEQVLWNIVDHHLDALYAQVSGIVKEHQGE